MKKQWVPNHIQNKLSNVQVQQVFQCNFFPIVFDKNKIQSFGETKDIINLDPLHEKWESYGWNTYDIDGHNHLEIKKAFIKAKKFIGKPSVIICNTIKGKGIKDFEGNEITYGKKDFKNPSLIIKRSNKL